MSFFQYKKDDRIYFKSDILDKQNGFVHSFTTKAGGVSHGKISGFNLGFRVNDNKESVCENYRLLANDLGLSLERTVLSKQTHTTNIRIVTEEDCGKGIVRESDINDTDGLVTNIPDIALVVFAADCVPILLCDPTKRVVAAIHAGWRGSIGKISSKCVEIMKSDFGSDPENILAAIGPSIGPCCFEFGSAAPEYFGEKYCSQSADGKYTVDLWSYNRDLLKESGLSNENIDVSQICTMCKSDLFYSYRSHKDATGRQGAVIMLKG